MGKRKDANQGVLLRRVGVSSTAPYLAGTYLVSGGTLGLPISGTRLAITLKFDFAFDRVGAHFAAVLHGERIPIEFTGNAKGDLVTLEFAVFNIGYPRLSSLASRLRNAAGDLVILGL